MNYKDLEIKIFTKVKKKKDSVNISAFGYENKENYLFYVSKTTAKKC